MTPRVVQVTLVQAVRSAHPLMCWLQVQRELVQRMLVQEVQATLALRVELHPPAWLALASQPAQHLAQRLWWSSQFLWSSSSVVW